jgi:hypothetical protein
MKEAMPNNPEYERAVLGGILLDGVKSLEVALGTDLEAIDFYDERHRIIYRTVYGLALKGTPIDPLTVRTALDADDQLENVGVEYMVSLTDGIPIGADFSHYARELRASAILRRLISTTTNFQNAALRNNGDIPGAITDLKSALESYQQGPHTGKSVPEIHWASEALTPQPAKAWIVHDLIGAGDVAALIGDAGSKKTWSALDLAVCVALGEEWLGRRVTRSSVLIVDEESGERRLKVRLGDCMRAHEAPSDLPVAFTTMQGITLTGDKGAGRLRQAISETKAVFVVMDALQDFTLGLDENSGKELAPVIHTLKVISEELSCAIWLIHHLNKQGGYRGHSSIKGLIDIMIKCESDPDSKLITFTTEKSRDSLILPFAATAHFDIGKFWLSNAEPKSTNDRLGRPERYVRDFMAKQPDKTATMTSITLNPDTCTQGSARKAIYDLVDKGLLVRVDEDCKRGVTATYKWVGL